MQTTELNKKEMQKINGGAISFSFINAINNIINTIYELGKETGSALTRLVSGNSCPTR